MAKLVDIQMTARVTCIKMAIFWMNWNMIIITMIMITITTTTMITIMTRKTVHITTVITIMMMRMSWTLLMMVAQLDYVVEAIDGHRDHRGRNVTTDTTVMVQGRVRLRLMGMMRLRTPTTRKRGRYQLLGV
jgi:hypothetical protein